MSSRGRAKSEFTLSTQADWMEDMHHEHWKNIQNMFVHFTHGPPRAEITPKDMKDLFDRYDENNNGFIERNEVRLLIGDAMTKAFEQQLSVLCELAKYHAPNSSYFTSEQLDDLLRNDHEERVSQKLESGPFEDIVDEFWSHLKTPNSDKVSREQFQERYRRAYANTLGVEENMDGWDPDDWQPGNNRDRFRYYRRHATVSPVGMYYVALLYAGEAGEPEEGFEDWQDDMDNQWFPSNQSKIMELSVSRKYEFDWLQRAAKKKYVPAIHRLAVLWYNNLIPSEIVEEEIEKNPPDAKDKLGEINYHFMRAFALFKEAAKLGDFHSSFQVGQMLVEGTGVEQSQRDALIWFERAAVQTKEMEDLTSRSMKGDVDAMYHLGVKYLLGSSFLPSDRVRALEWFRQAASKKNLDAMYSLALLNYLGIDGMLKPSPEKAKEIWQEAADLGHHKSMETLEKRIRLDEIKRMAAAGTPLGEEYHVSDLPLPGQEYEPSHEERHTCRQCEGGCVVS